jgi:hypothetical protein
MSRLRKTELEEKERKEGGERGEGSKGRRVAKEPVSNATTKYRSRLPCRKKKGQGEVRGRYRWSRTVCPWSMYA